MKISFAPVAGMIVLTLGCHHKAPQNIQTDLSSKVTEGELIEAIDVRGSIQITNGVIMNGLHSRAGGRISLPAIRSDIQFLYSLGFEDVRVAEEPGSRVGKVVLFTVREKASQPQKPTP